MTSKMADLGINAVRQARVQRGLTQGELARRAGISRQALGAIEAGTYQPGVAVALALARELGESVEHLFGGGAHYRHVDARWVTGEARTPGRIPVALARVGGKLVAVAQPAMRMALAPAAGMLERAARHHAEVGTYLSPGEIDLTLLIAGCDPAVAMLGDFFARHRLAASAVALPSSSHSALTALHEGRVHIAGAHLRDPRTGEYNLQSVGHLLKGQRTVLINFAQWELGLAVAPNNPKGIRGFADLARSDLRMVNREVGSGARLFLDESVAGAGLDRARIAGYTTELPGHLEVAYAVACGQADLGVTIRVAAQACGCGFLPMRLERYDLVMFEGEMEGEPLKALLDTLSARRFAAEVSQLCLYDTQRMGEVVARID
jgi:putative molybdopterin biosynthesis protein